VRRTLGGRSGREDAPRHLRRGLGRRGQPALGRAAELVVELQLRRKPRARVPDRRGLHGRGGSDRRGHARGGRLEQPRGAVRERRGKPARPDGGQRRAALPLSLQLRHRLPHAPDPVALHQQHRGLRGDAAGTLRRGILGSGDRPRRPARAGRRRRAGSGAPAPTGLQRKLDGQARPRHGGDVRRGLRPRTRPPRSRPGGARTRHAARPGGRRAAAVARLGDRAAAAGARGSGGGARLCRGASRAARGGTGTLPRRHGCSRGAGALRLGMAGGSARVAAPHPGRRHGTLQGRRGLPPAGRRLDLRSSGRRARG